MSLRAGSATHEQVAAALTAMPRESMSTTEPIEVVPGQRWRHFKGGEYVVLHVATNAETDAPVVVYQADYGDRGVFTRSLRNWHATVLKPGDKAIHYVPRFELIEPVPKNP